MIPFTAAEFLRVFEQYNEAVWPSQIVLYLLALFAFGLTFKDTRAASKTINVILAVVWLWSGVVYHLLFFSTINGLAFLFAGLFIAQSLIFIFAGVLKQTLSFSFRRDIGGIVGSFLMVSALVVYPLLGMLFGHRYPTSPTFGVPCPTTIFTVGVLLAGGKRIPEYVIVIPLIWSVFGFWAALSLGMIEDFGLVIGGISSSVIILRRQSQAKLVINSI